MDGEVETERETATRQLADERKQGKTGNLGPPPTCPSHPVIISLDRGSAKPGLRDL
jgi:hypothetical protein